MIAFKYTCTCMYPTTDHMRQISETNCAKLFTIHVYLSHGIIEYKHTIQQV